MKKYPFLDLGALTAPLAAELKEAVGRVIDSGRFLHGPATAELEERLASSCGAAHCVAVSNGLDALRLIFRAYRELGRLSEGDEVIVAANTYIASVLAISDNGLRPILAEPEPLTMNLDPERLEPLIGERTKAILEVHLYGTPCRHSAIAEVARRHGLIVVEDNAQAIGAKEASLTTGGMGHASAFSFYPTKNIGALGDAGAVCTDSAELAAAVRALANYGSDRRYHNIYRGYNCRMDELQAAMLGVKLSHLQEVIEGRRAAAAAYQAGIDNPLIIKPAVIEGMTQVWHQYVVRVKGAATVEGLRERFRAYLDACGVATDVHYATPPHMQPCYEGWFEGSYPLTEQLAAEVVSLPIAGVSAEDAARISEIINGFKLQ